MSKERLERIIQMQYDGYTIWDMGENDLIWLIKQAERTEELEKKTECYREALEFYADSKNWLPQNEDVLSEITMDYGSIARKALEESE